MQHSINTLITTLAKELTIREWKLVTAESCTGGGLAYALTNIPGSSNWFERGFVTYSNSAKEECLGVKPETLTTFGAVSEETVREMAEGALKHSEAQVSVAITGIAGPDGGSKDKPVGTVWVGFAAIEKITLAERVLLTGTRAAVREKTIEWVLEKLIKYI